MWADGDDKDKPGLHTNFKISQKGETVMLVDADARGNQVLDSVEFDKQETDASFGRFPDGKGEFLPLAPTPGQANLSK